ncbi:hypothetical protein C8241_07920 [Paracidovorax avenae]|uniref:hypothetical protein n=1 Tax=Paracidovorax avenae TaxID=80867 RepID=UPI000D15578F|nr:hypothetical protein [Paracidovorax avenae]AVS61649.1 hypothetical protein C8241_07920 [Paracidovorax avenae]
MVTQLDSPDGKPRKDPGRPSPAFVETDDRRSIEKKPRPPSHGDTAQPDREGNRQDGLTD